ncbi:hypothetical protein ACFSYH_12920 [Populibacterium corticicola]|uniref:Uncharacterized protein n=1 Tax=Populibacterium corticicola TaxID=1812826 RepID=A0ABW5XG57_9MICO
MTIASTAGLVCVFSGGIILILLGFFVKRKRPTTRSHVLPTVLGIVLIAASGLFMLKIFSPGMHDYAWVNGVNEGEQFDLEVRHQRQYVSGQEYYFVTDKDWSELLSLLEQQFPSGQLNAQDEWFLPSATTPVIVSPSGSDSHEFKIVAQTARITGGDDGSGMEIPFPVSALQRDNLPLGQQVPLIGVSSVLTDFYSDIPGVELRANEVKVPGQRGQKVLLRFAENSVTALKP